MSDTANMVREFHDRFGVAIANSPRLSDADTNWFRWWLISEELGELAEALSSSDLIEAADALANLTYVIYGAALTWGIDLDAVIAGVHRSNMTKTRPSEPAS